MISLLPEFLQLYVALKFAEKQSGEDRQLFLSMNALITISEQGN
jgi:hypothetical protein